MAQSQPFREDCYLQNIHDHAPMVVADRILFRDVDFNVSSKFIPEVVATDDTIAIFPSQIQQKCISVSLENKTYICSLPYRIYGD